MALLLVASVCAADTLRVPEDYATIPLAITAAATGDHVIVAAGQYSYSEFINFAGKDISVESEDGPEVTVLDFAFGGIGFESGESNAAVLKGFTILGANVGMFGASPSIIDNVLIGGRIMVSSAGTDPAGPIIRGNHISGNIHPSGGGLFIGAPAIVESNIIVDNIASESPPSGLGGGVYVREGPVVLRNNFIAGNQTVGCCSYGAGIAIDCCAEVLIDGNTIVDNVAEAQGGGIGMFSQTGVLITNCIVYGNTAPLDSQIASYPPVSVSYSDVEGGYPGTMVLDVDPMFVSGPLGDAYLSVDSPLVDAGDPDSPIPDGTTRVDQFQDVGIIDIGYHYGFGHAFVRGDCNGDGTGDISDAVSLLSMLFVPGTDPATCDAACNVNSDPVIDISDAIYELSWLFAFGAEPESPFPDCGYDHSGYSVTCSHFGACP